MEEDILNYSPMSCFVGHHVYAKLTTNGKTSKIVLH